MDNLESPNPDQSGGRSIAQIIAFTSAAAVTAAVIGIAAFVYLQYRSASTPQAFLDRCQSAIDSIERGLDEYQA